MKKFSAILALLLVSISCFSFVCYAYSTPEESLSPSTAMSELPDETDEKFELAFESPALLKKISIIIFNPMQMLPQLSMQLKRMQLLVMLLASF